jgi:hypothetical protein
MTVINYKKCQKSFLTAMIDVIMQLIDMKNALCRPSNNMCQSPSP